MKDFLKYTLATVCGLCLVGAVLFLISIVTLIGISASESQIAPLPKEAMLRISLNGELKETTQSNPLQDLLGEDYAETSLKSTTEAIRLAKDNKNIKGIYLDVQSLYGAQPAMLEEMRQTIMDFKKSGKPVIAYADNYTQGTYYVCSAADIVAINPQGTLVWQGLAAQPIFYKDLLEKVGVKMQVFKVGSYKSAVEPYTATQMSEANKEQVSAYLTDIWQEMVTNVSKSRNIPVSQLNEYADSMLTFQPASELKQKHMVDTILYIDQLHSLLKQKLNIKEKQEIAWASPEQLLATQAPEDKDKIAVYYASGDIVDQETNLNAHEISAEKVCRELKQLRNDDDIKAVVLRINSGGGSAYASEQMWRELTLLAQEKPLVVSMSGMAASGAYYMSCAGSYIVAQPTTLTGSIGIFGLIPDASSLMTDKLGLHFDVVKTHEHADFGNLSRPFTPTETHIMQDYIERGYQLFTSRVAQGRHLDAKAVEKIAQGRVWTGNQALQNGLIDAIGGMDKAVEKAAQLAHIKSYALENYPKPALWWESLLSTQKEQYLESSLKSALGQYHSFFQALTRLKDCGSIQTRLPYTISFNN